MYILGVFFISFCILKLNIYELFTRKYFSKQKFHATRLTFQKCWELEPSASHQVWQIFATPVFPAGISSSVVDLEHPTHAVRSCASFSLRTKKFLLRLFFFTHEVGAARKKIEFIEAFMHNFCLSP